WFAPERGAATALRIMLGGRTAGRPFVALEDINLDIRAGHRVGVVGNNGAGKTTLLKTLAGVYRPSAGELTVNGDLTMLAGLGSGMLEELTVEENAILYAAIHGVSRRRMVQHMSDMLAWAELSDFASTRLKNLSTGMRTRLAFSTMRYIDKDVYLMDEALTAGDKSFAGRCEAVFDDYQKSGRTFVVASHNLDFVQRFCTHVLWLQCGRVAGYGPPDEVLDQYRQQS
ncbi:MAG TPA: ABC transporter ATP-binding protein, partial [Candidatus Xenobia bacterium]